jgi:monothiol glutaredoxin
MQKPTVTVYLKPTCGWSNGVRAVLEKYNLDYTEKDINAFPEFRREMEEQSGQRLSPCVVVNGTMLADIGGEELERHLVGSGLVEPSDGEPVAPTHSCCLR